MSDESGEMMTALKMQSMDYFERLGKLSANCTTDDVKKAYRRLGLLYHPDKNKTNPETNEIFTLIKQAHEVLVDPDARQRYWLEQEMKREAEVVRNPYARESSRPPTVGEAALKRALSNTHVRAAKSKFSSGGGGGAATGSKPKAGAIRLYATFTLEELDAGLPKQKDYGVMINTAMRSVKRPTTSVVQAPYGALDGDTITHRGAGDSYAGGERGDVIFIVKQAEHRVFKKRVGADLYMVHTISPMEMLTGVKFVLRTVYGVKERVECAPPLKDEQQIRLAGLGMRKKGISEGAPDDPRGDVIVCIRVDPTLCTLDDEQLRKIREIVGGEKKKE